jgi:Cys-tRNA(Pro)/Cys-tRNA(Cys) deacylase
MSATPATAALDAANIAYQLHSYDHDPANTNYGAEAAAALGIDPEQMFKTLIIDIGHARPELAVAVVPVARQLGLKQFASVIGAKKASLADAALVSRATGYVLGGVSPLGQKVALPTVIDETAQLWDTVFVSAGRRGLDLELAPADLAKLAAASFADIAR